MMEETNCDLHIVREAVSGLADQKRMRITGPSLKDVEFAGFKVQELLYDLTRFGTLNERHFDMREGPTAAADLVPRGPRLGGPGSGVAISILMPKDDVAWIIG